MQRDDVIWVALGVPDQRIPSGLCNDLAISPDEALRKFIGIVQTLDEITIPRRPCGAVIWVNNFVPLLYATQVILAVAQNLGLCTVRQVLTSLDVQNSDPNLGVLENCPEELLARSQSLGGTAVLGDVFSESHDVLWLAGGVPQ